MRNVPFLTDFQAGVSQSTSESEICESTPFLALHGAATHHTECWIACCDQLTEYTFEISCLLARCYPIIFVYVQSQGMEALFGSQTSAAASELPSSGLQHWASFAGPRDSRSPRTSGTLTGAAIFNGASECGIPPTRCVRPLSKLDMAEQSCHSWSPGAQGEKGACLDLKP